MSWGTIKAIASFALPYILGGDDSAQGQQGGGRRGKTLADKLRDLDVDTRTSMGFISKGPKHRVQTANLGAALSPDRTGPINYNRYKQYASNEYKSVADVKKAVDNKIIVDSREDTQEVKIKSSQPVQRRWTTSIPME
jgi:hypothetical protein